MAVHQLGIGAVIHLDNRQAVRSMGEASRGFNNLTRNVTRLNSSLNSVARVGVKAVVGGAIAMTAGVALGARSLFKFEQQMKNVQSVTRGLSNKDFKNLSTEAQRLGATTSFTATQAAQGMEQLGRSGFSATQQIGQMTGVLHLAEFGNVSLSKSATVVSDTIKGMGLVMGTQRETIASTTRVTNALAHAARSTATDIPQLQQALKYTMGDARSFNVPLEQLVSTLANMGDAALRSGMGGRNLSSMFRQLAAPKNKKAIELLKEAKFQATDFRMLGMQGALNKLNKFFNTIKDKNERLAAMQDVLGTQGRRGFLAATATGPSSIRNLTREMHQAQADNIVSKLAESRLDTTRGAWIKLKSAIEGANIAFFGVAIGGRVKTSLEAITTHVRNITMAFSALRDGRGIDHFSTGVQKAAHVLSSVADKAAAALSSIQLGLYNLDIGAIARGFEKFAIGVSSFYSGIGRGIKEVTPFFKDILKLFGIDFDAQGPDAFATAMEKLGAALPHALKYFLEFKAAMLAMQIANTAFSVGAGIMSIASAFKAVKATGGIAGMLRNAAAAAGPLGGAGAGGAAAGGAAAAASGGGAAAAAGGGAAAGAAARITTGAALRTMGGVVIKGVSRALLPVGAILGAINIGKVSSLLYDIHTLNKEQSAMFKGWGMEGRLAGLHRIKEDEKRDRYTRNQAAGPIGSPQFIKDVGASMGMSESQANIDYQSKIEDAIRAGHPVVWGGALINPPVNQLASMMPNQQFSTPVPMQSQNSVSGQSAHEYGQGMRIALDNVAQGFLSNPLFDDKISDKETAELQEMRDMLVRQIELQAAEKDADATIISNLWKEAIDRFKDAMYTAGESMTEAAINGQTSAQGAGQCVERCKKRQKAGRRRSVNDRLGASNPPFVRRYSAEQGR